MDKNPEALSFEPVRSLTMNGLARYGWYPSIGSWGVCDATPRQLSGVEVEVVRGIAHMPDVPTAIARRAADLDQLA